MCHMYGAALLQHCQSVGLYAVANDMMAKLLV